MILLRAYSNLNLIGEELSLLKPMSEAKGFLNKMLDGWLYSPTSRVTLKIPVPGHMYIRARCFCDDVSEVQGERFRHVQLIDILYHDFLYFIRKNNDPQSIYNMLRLKDGTIVISEHEDERIIDTLDDESDYIAEFSYSMARKDALRGEYILSDLSKVYPDHDYTLERVIQILYCDFIDEYSKGKMQNVVERIINYNQKNN